MVLDLITNKIGGEEFISLPVALRMDYTEIRAPLTSAIINPVAKKVLDWFANKHSRIGADNLYVRIRQDLNPSQTLHEVRCRKTGELQFNYSIAVKFK